jgi:thiamine-phosphate pyrophosphorylase
MDSRDSMGDIGGKAITESEKRRADLSSVIQSNCSRAAESVRVFEEFSKLLSKRHAASWKKLRFHVYSVEKELLLGAVKGSVSSRLKNIGLYCIIDRMFLGRRSPASVAREMVRGGAKIIQYRDKTSCDGEFLRRCKRIRKVCVDAEVLFIVNDRTDVALLADADGVHLGQDDMPVSEARRILGPGKIVGKSCHSRGQSAEAAEEEIDYLAVGAVFPTTTKERPIVIGPEYLSKMRRKIGSLPLVAIGGINRKNIGAVLSQKPDGICIVRAILTAPDIAEAVRGFVRIVRKGMH